MTVFYRNHEVNNDIDTLLNGQFQLEVDILEEAGAWANVLYWTDEEKETSPIIRVMTKAQYQESFKKTNEKASSNST